jgi:hypothetical protein
MSALETFVVSACQRSCRWRPCLSTVEIAGANRRSVVQLPLGGRRVRIDYLTLHMRSTLASASGKIFAIENGGSYSLN